MSDKPRLRDVEAREEAATEGPWEARTSGVRHGDHWYVMDAASSIASIHASDGEDEEQREPDATFIAASRTDVPALTAAIRAVLAIHPEHISALRVRAALEAHIDLEES